MNAADVEQLEQKIIRYLEMHPNAADTAEGIATWWLDCNYGICSQNKVKKALDRLVEKKLLRLRRSIDGHTLYSKPVHKS